MPFSYDIDPARELARVTLSGSVTGYHVCDAHRAVASDSAWRPGYCRLWDYRGVTVLDFLPEHVRALVEALQEPRCRALASASIVHRPAHEMLAENLALIWKTWPVHAFPDEEAALAWLRDQQRRAAHTGA